MDSILRGEVPPGLAEDLAKDLEEDFSIAEQRQSSQETLSCELHQGTPMVSPSSRTRSSSTKNNVVSETSTQRKRYSPLSKGKDLKYRLPKDSDAAMGIDYSKWDHFQTDDEEEQDDEEEERELHFSSKIHMDRAYYHDDSIEEDEPKSHAADDAVDNEEANHQKHENEDESEDIPHYCSCGEADCQSCKDRELVNAAISLNPKLFHAFKEALHETPSTILHHRDTVVKAKADSLKAQGNSAFKLGKFERAIRLYDDAIAVYNKANSNDGQERAALRASCFSMFPKPMVPLIPVDPALFTNRALAHLRLCDFDKAKEDCDAALSLDPNNIKALWRKVEALKGLRLFPQALSVINELESKATHSELIGITLEDIRKMAKSLEEDSLNHAHEQDLMAYMDSDGSKAFMEKILLSLERGIDEQKGNQITENLGVTCSVLMKHLDSQDAASDAFRILNGFERLSKRVSMDTVPTIMPIFMCLLHNNPINRKRLAKQLPTILNKIFSLTPDGTRITTTAMVVDLAGNCSRDNDCLQTLIHQASQQWTEHLGVTTMTVLAMKRNSIRGSVHIYYALAFAHALLASSKGIDAFFRVYKFNLSHFLTSLGQHFVYESIQGESKSFLDLCMESLFYVLNAEIPVKQLAVNHAMHSLAGAICAAMQHPEAPLSRLITLFYNLCIYLDHPILDILAQHDLPLFLLHHYHSDPTENGTSWRCLAKLAKYHGRFIGQMLEDESNEEDLKKALLAHKSDPSLTKASLQLLSCWLQTSECNVGHWFKVGGFEVLVGMLKEEMAKPEMDGYVTGNVALCLGECARKAEHSRALIKMDAIDPLVHVLRKTIGEPGVQRNLAIVCARLCQVVEGLEKVRALKGIELMYGLGNKIVKTASR